jgi:hypothetical protein
MLPPRDEKPWKRTKADYVLEKEHMTEVIQWMQTLSFPDRFLVNLRRGANLDTG